MRQTVIVISLLGSLMLFAMTINLFDTLVMFLLFGILPGQDTPVSANQMLTIYSGATVVVVAYALRGSVALILRAIRLTRRTA